MAENQKYKIKESEPNSNMETGTNDRNCHHNMKTADGHGLWYGLERETS